MDKLSRTDTRTPDYGPGGIRRVILRYGEKNQPRYVTLRITTLGTFVWRLGSETT